MDDWLTPPANEDQESFVVLEFIHGPTGLNGADGGSGENVENQHESALMKSRHVKTYMNLDAGLSETTETLSFSHPKQDCSADFRFPLPPNSAVRR